MKKLIEAAKADKKTAVIAALLVANFGLGATALTIANQPPLTRMEVMMMASAISNANGGVSDLREEIETLSRKVATMAGENDGYADLRGEISKLGGKIDITMTANDKLSRQVIELEDLTRSQRMQILALQSEVSQLRLTRGRF